MSAETCNMPIGFGLSCTLPADHTSGCQAPEACRCSHGRSLHYQATGQCWISVCACARFRPLSDPAGTMPTAHIATSQEQK